MQQKKRLSRAYGQSPSPVVQSGAVPLKAHTHTFSGFILQHLLKPNARTDTHVNQTWGKISLSLFLKTENCEEAKNLRQKKKKKKKSTAQLFVRRSWGGVDLILLRGESLVPSCDGLLLPRLPLAAPGEPASWSEELQTLTLLLSCSGRTDTWRRKTKRRLIERRMLRTTATSWRSEQIPDFIWFTVALRRRRAVF